MVLVRPGLSEKGLRTVGAASFQLMQKWSGWAKTAWPTSLQEDPERAIGTLSLFEGGGEVSPTAEGGVNSSRIHLKFLASFLTSLTPLPS